MRSQTYFSLQPLQRHAAGLGGQLDQVVVVFFDDEDVQDDAFEFFGLDVDAVVAVGHQD
jgi:hypothetical protein